MKSFLAFVHNLHFGDDNWKTLVHSLKMLTYTITQRRRMQTTKSVIIFQLRLNSIHIFPGQFILWLKCSVFNSFVLNFGVKRGIRADPRTNTIIFGLLRCLPVFCLSRCSSAQPDMHKHNNLCVLKWRMETNFLSNTGTKHWFLFFLCFSLASIFVFFSPYVLSFISLAHCIQN